MTGAGDRTVLVVGGGIGGLTSALAFARRGFDVHLFEQAAHFGEIGAGIQLSPNCVRVLYDLGLEARLRKVAFVPEGTEMRDWKNGNIISANALGAAAVEAYGYPYFHVHRADLMDALVGCAGELGNVHLHANARCESFGQTRDGVEANIGGRRVSGALLIGADGIHSSVRAQLFGSESPQTADGWRGRTRTCAVADPQVADLRDESAYRGRCGVSVNRCQLTAMPRLPRAFRRTARSRFQYGTDKLTMARHKDCRGPYRSPERSNSGSRSWKRPISRLKRSH